MENAGSVSEEKVNTSPRDLVSLTRICAQRNQSVQPKRTRARSKTPSRRDHRGEPKSPLGDDVNRVAVVNTRKAIELESNKSNHLSQVARLRPEQYREEKILWTIELADFGSKILLSCILSVSKLYFGERGYSPFQRFFFPDRQEDSWQPTWRVLFFLALGFLLSLCGIYLTEDPYIHGSHFFLEDDGPDKHVADGALFPVHIAFHDVGCRITGRPDPILSGVTGHLQPGHITAILGGSGSGKTTLVKRLLGQSKAMCDTETGMVYMNGLPSSLEKILDRVGFVPQDDMLYRELTIRETLWFNVETRLPPLVSRAYKSHIIEETISLLGLDHIADAQVRARDRGELSGGEMKRLSIAMELVSSPSVLVMDEPTSGLDSAAAFRLVRTLREISDRGVAVLVVLHQPTTRIYNLIDDLVLLRSGRPIYIGPRAEVMPYFLSHGFVDAVTAGNSQNGTRSCVPGSLVPSDPELLLDMLSVSSPPLKRKLLEASNDAMDTSWETIETEMKRSRLEELQRIGWPKEKAQAQLDSEFVDVLGSCEEPSLHSTLGSYLRSFVENNSSGWDSTRYPNLPRPGFFKQVQQRMWIVSTVWWRKGILLEFVIVIVLAATVSLTRSYNMTWDRRPLGGFFLSISMSLMGIFSALFNDDIGPVQRAIGTGMQSSSYQAAQVLFTWCRAVLVVNVYSTVYFSGLYLRRGYWCCKPFKILKYLEFQHALMLTYMCAQSAGSAMCLVAGHDLVRANEMTLAMFYSMHSFAFFAPKQNQVEQDSLFLGRLNSAPLVNLLCSVSFVRYFVEAVMIWEPKDEDEVGRRGMLRSFGYREEHKSKCYTCLFACWAIQQSIVLLLFKTNSGDELIRGKLPAVIFMSKVLASFLLALVIMTLIHEAPRLKHALALAIDEHCEAPAETQRPVSAQLSKST
mmetsp:Transcript_23689/g.43995  ORF Transcript_23689/g.43995 Transcript_23689/m.43995 type:complete len:916 (+) Transcript_23689:247-2994(+)